MHDSARNCVDICENLILLYFRVTNIATLDNGTMVEAFKYLNYCQLAKNNVVSKRFSDLIRTHRHSLALLYVDDIRMSSIPIATDPIQIFDKELSSEAYNEWVIRNNYSKHAPLEDQVASTQSTQNISNVYWLYARANYNDPNHREWNDVTTVFSAEAKVNHESWPVFQHFVRLATDPFIYIDCMELNPQNDVLNLLAGAINSDRLECKELSFTLNGNNQKSITWAKNHVRCNQFSIYGRADLNQDEAFLDFLLTGAHCTPSIKISYRDISKAMDKFLQKFMNLKNADECQFVEAIEGNFKYRAAELFMHDYAEFLNVSSEQFVNYKIGKKLQFTVEDHTYFRFSIKISNL
ncbi:hypothetical protein DdX_19091 [Ditylenchus destructor]|uniref:Uncharacterized protein n=1 Tax=Ditylenchus destructor TaxID=166010 RepID=A0AAD4MII6_9BILA|nr:hypothetical protein DdX_19091 [Ditylenchus destructor]